MTESSAFIPYPPSWIGQLKPLLGDQLPDFLRCLEEAPARGLRMRPGLAPINDALSPVPWAENAWYLPLSSNAGAVPLHEAGAYYLQEPSAMAAASALRPDPGDRVLDLCAAPGGKSTQLAAYMQGEGVLVCNEPVPSRAKILSRNIERMGVANAVVISALPESLSPLWPDFFDKILVDAPCSGEGMFRRHPETRLEWQESAPAGCAQRQARILDEAARMLRPGGKMAYSTCTLNETENERVIEGFLARHADFRLTPFRLPGLPPCGGMLRLWPHLIRGEGHFVALMEKEADGKNRAPQPEVFSLPGKGELALSGAFLSAHYANPPRPNALFAGRIVAAPRECPPLKGVKALRLGLHLGEARGKLFFPDHALALWQAPSPALPVSEAEAAAYQRGETLIAPPPLKGFCAPTLSGLALGWGKASDGQIKNHYPKGLRC